MAGNTALKLSQKMTALKRKTDKGFLTVAEATQHFFGYAAALADMEEITEKEYEMFITEFSKEILK